MEITNKLKNLYLSYFKNEEEFNKAFSFHESYSRKLLMKKFISVAINNNIFEFTSDFKGIIDLPKYQIKFAILPTGDCTYFTINKISKRKGNYSRITKITTLYKRLIKLGVISAEKSIIEIITSDSELIELLNIANIEGDKGIIRLSLDMSMNIDFPIMEGLASIEYTDEQFDFEPIEVGNIDFKIINSNHFTVNSLFYAADAISIDDSILIDSFIDEFEDEISYGIKFLTLDRIKIDPIFRNKGIGKSAIKELINVCEVLDIQYIVLQPAPIENVSFKEDKKIRNSKISKLVKYYEKFGFIKYQQKGKEPFMVLEVETYF